MRYALCPMRHALCHMKHLSFRMIFLCIFLPPVLYIFSILGLETFLQKKYFSDLQKTLISDTTALLQGQIGIQQQIQQNIVRYLNSRHSPKWGVLINVVVKTGTGRWLYPVITPETFDLSSSEGITPPSGPFGPMDTLKVAEENLEIMDEKISLAVTVQIPRNTWLANAVLIFYIFLFSMILYRAYAASAKEAEQLSLLNQEALEAASAKLEDAQQRLTDLADVEQNYQLEIEELRTEVTAATEKVQATEDEALMEMESLEEKLRKSVGLREELESEVLRLGEEVERLESRQKTTTKKQAKQIDDTIKRFRTLYKNLEFHDRAAAGFLNLTSGKSSQEKEP